ncbi:MAG: hypothetical protein U1A27_09620 [Phycisphaerae bacterium]
MRSTRGLGVSAGLVMAGLLAACGAARGEPAGRATAGAGVRVASEAELRAAAARSERESVNIVIDSAITVRHGVYFPPSESIVRLTGVTPEASLTFEMAYGSAAAARDHREENGLEFHCRQAIVTGLTLHGYDKRGALLKGHTRELLYVGHCTFEGVGTRQYPLAAAAARNAEETVCNHCIAAHELRQAHVSVVNCTFRRCALSAQRWSHCVYVSARSVVVMGNKFDECGNPFSIGGSAPGASVTVIGNEVSHPQATPGADGRVHAAFMASLTESDFAAYVGNRFAGRFETPWTGQPTAGLHWVDYNDYGAAAVAGPWGAHTGRGEWIGWEKWRSMGFDGHSTPPRATEQPGNR